MKKKVHKVRVLDEKQKVARAGWLDGEHSRDVSDHADAIHGEHNTRKQIIEICPPRTYVSNKTFSFGLRR